MNPSRQRPERVGARSEPALPEWDLGDLYPAPDAPAVRADLEAALADAKALEAEFKGRLADGVLKELVVVRRQRDVLHVLVADVDVLSRGDPVNAQPTAALANPPDTFSRTPS